MDPCVFAILVLNAIIATASAAVSGFYRQNVCINMKPSLSIIIPAFNEVERIALTLNSVHNYLKKNDKNAEIIVVDDGSSDGTDTLVRKLSDRITELRLIRLPRNEGKGAAVRIGMLSAQGEFRLFMDADNATSIEQVDLLIPFIREGYDVVIGSRRIRGAAIQIKQSLIREVLGMCFRITSQLLVPLNFADTQTGFKLFTERSSVLLFKELKTKGWVFDIEILLKARDLHLKVKEIPIIWTNSRGSKLKITHMFSMLFDLLQIKLRANHAHSLPEKHDILK
jgi:dolichyl-phosphate beta-glucosyltransferase